MPISENFQRLNTDPHASPFRLLQLRQGVLNRQGCSHETHNRKDHNLVAQLSSSAAVNPGSAAGTGCSAAAREFFGDPFDLSLLVGASTR